MGGRLIEFEGLILVRCTGGPFESLRTDIDTERAIGILGFSPSDVDHLRLKNGLQVALMHNSYLYENKSSAPALTGSVLSMLESLGKSWVHRQLTLWAYNSIYTQKPGPLAVAIGQGMKNFPSWVNSLGWPVELAAVGRGESLSMAPSVGTKVFFQVFGLLCILGAETRLRQLISPYESQFNASPVRAFDAKTLLQEYLGRPPIYTVTRTGPDHSATFSAVVSDGRRHSTQATGSSKKSADQNAAIEFLRAYAPATLAHALEKKSPSRSVSESRLDMVRGAGREHERGVLKVAEIFGLGKAATGLVSQAFIHSSFSYETQTEMTRSGQRDNRVLALVGSAVLNFEQALGVSRSIFENPDEEFRLLTPLSSTFADVTLKLGLETALLRGKGESTHDIPTESASNAFQALAAAVYLSKGMPRSLFEIWPADWEIVRDIVMPTSAHERSMEDQVTALQEYATAAGLEYEFLYEVKGPDNAKVFRAKILLTSRALAKQHTLSSPIGARSKGAAKQAAAAIVTTAIRYASEGPGDRGGAPNGDGELLKFIVAHLLNMACISRSAPLAWRKRRLLGCHLGDHAGKLLDWSGAIDALAPPSFDQENFALFLRQAFASGGQPLDPIAGELRAVLDWVDKLGVPPVAASVELDNVVLLCAAYRAMSVPSGELSLHELIEDWALLYRNRVAISPAEYVGLSISAADSALLEAIVKLGAKTGVVRASLEGNDFAINLTGCASAEQVGTLACAVSPRVVANSSATDLTLRLRLDADQATAGPVGKAAMLALDPAPSPLAGAIANLLHDLKNQLSAAVQAAAVEPLDRTARLEQELSASRHLDKASALSTRLRAATLSLTESEKDNCNLGLALRAYSIRAVASLPQNVQLSVPAVPSKSFLIDLDSNSFTAVLDNLVKNAVEAMPDGGSIYFDWTSDDEEAVLEVADTGPGLSVGISASVAGHGVIASTKAGGNGIGLMSVRTVLHRVGGQITHIPSSKGTVWHLNLPRSTGIAKENK